MLPTYLRTEEPVICRLQDRVTLHLYLNGQGCCPDSRSITMQQDTQ